MTTAVKVTVYVPCDVVAVRVRLGYDETLTPMEQIALRAVHAGADTFQDLSTTLGLGPRLTIDLLQDLWRAGYIRLVRSHAGVKVTDDVARRIRNGELARLASAETVDGVREVMIDKLSGHVLPATAFRTPAQRRFAVPVETSSVQITDATIPELLDAVERSLEQEERDRVDPGGRRSPATGRRRRVLGAHLAAGELGSVGRRWLPVDVRPTVDPDTDRLTVTVVGDALPETHRTAASLQLTRLAERTPKEEFFKSLRGQAIPGFAEAPEPVQATARLRDQAVTAAGIPAGQRKNWHNSLQEVSRQLGGILADQADREVTAEVVVGPDHVPALAALIDGARNQLVLAAPWLGYEALEAVVPALRSALRRGVQVLLLWGIGHGQELDQRVRNVLYDTDLRRSKQPGSGRLLVPRTSTRTHVKLAVADDRQALVTSWNMLNSRQPGKEVGVLVRHPDGAGCRIALDLLQWARSAVPAYEMSRLLLVTEQEFALRDDAGSGRQPWRRSDPVVLGLPGTPQEPDDRAEEAAADAAREWSLAWVGYADRVAGWLAARRHPAAQVVLDSDHRDLLWRAVRTAQRRLVIASDQLSGKVVDDRLVAALAAALERGVDVTIVYGRPHPKDMRISLEESGPRGGADPVPAEVALTELAGRQPGRLRVSRTGNHAKILIRDDEVVVGSFNFLSFEGFPSTGSGHRDRSELSLRLSGRAIADAVARAVGVAVEDRPDGRAVAPAVAPAGPVDGGFLAGQLILNMVAAGSAPADAVAAHLHRDGDPWGTLDRLAVNADREVLRIAVATCLGGAGGADGTGPRGRWTRWLVEDLWLGRRYVESLVVRTAVGDPEFRPRRPIATLAAARGTGSYPSALDQALTVLDGPPAVPAGPDGPVTDGRQLWISERTAVVAAALDQVVFVGGHDAAVVLEFERPGARGPDDALDDVWGTLAEAAVAYSADSLARPVPLEHIRRELYGQRGREALDAAWSRLDQALVRAGNTKLDNSASLRTHMYLFSRTGGLFARLAAATQGRRGDELRKWLAELPGRANVGQLIDDAAAVAAPGEQPMYGSYRRRYTKLLQSIVDETRTVVRLDDFGDVPDDSDVDALGLLAAARRLAAEVSGVWDELSVLAERAASPEEVFVGDLVHDLEELAVWGGHRRGGAEAGSLRPAGSAEG